MTFKVQTNTFSKNKQLSSTAKFEKENKNNYQKCFITFVKNMSTLFCSVIMLKANLFKCIQRLNILKDN